MDKANIAKSLGEEFLTWLWFKSEEQSGLFTLEGESFALYFSGKVVVEGGEGESLEKTICSGEMSELAEAKQGLKRGKKVTQAKLRFEQDSFTWQMQVKGEDFSFSQLKTPKIEMRLEEGEGDEGRFLEKMYLIEKCLGFFWELYKEFLELRFSERWKEEKNKISNWIAKE
ncbi:MAG: hypothetical protein PWR24_1827 [Desulfonauticus sp.]|jgi:hypothetical protein|nr:MAG: Uncharacterized protein XD41_1583 [Desulfonauticus sp. 38_4375]MDK2922270.1 hypothetical protein [Desulfonauticus sp.]